MFYQGMQSLPQLCALSLKHAALRSPRLLWAGVACLTRLVQLTLDEVAVRSRHPARPRIRPSVALALGAHPRRSSVSSARVLLTRVARPCAVALPPASCAVRALQHHGDTSRLPLTSGWDP